MVECVLTCAFKLTQIDTCFLCRCITSIICSVFIITSSLHVCVFAPVEVGLHGRSPRDKSKSVAYHLKHAPGQSSSGGYKPTNGVWCLQASSGRQLGLHCYTHVICLTLYNNPLNTPSQFGGLFKLQKFPSTLSAYQCHCCPVSVLLPVLSAEFRVFIHLSVSVVNVLAGGLRSLDKIFPSWPEVLMGNGHTASGA